MHALLPFVLFLGIVSGLNPYLNFSWEADTIDLGNGGDKTFYLLLHCKECHPSSPPPLFLWLSGGPGSSSIEAQYFQNGPYLFNDTYQLEYNPYSWARYVDIMYVDNPVGVPFSVAKSKATLCRNQSCVARNLYTMLAKFMDGHPEYKRRPLYLVGESFAGHYIPHLSTYLISARNPDINFVGAGIGNGVLNIYEQLPYYPDYLLMMGNITMGTYMWEKLQTMICMVAKTYEIEVFDYFCNTLVYTIAEDLNLTDPTDITNRNESDPELINRFNAYINSTEMKRALGTEGRNYYSWSTEANLAMRNDWSLALSGDIAYALDNGKRIVLWYGDKDYICNYLGGKKVIENLPWHGKAAFNAQELKSWPGEGKEMGLTRKHENLKYIQVYNAGHSIFSRQREAGVKILDELLSPS